MSGVSRRTALGLGAGATLAAAGGLATPLLLGSGRRPGTGELLPSEVPLPTAYTRPLVVPRTATPVDTTGGVDRYAITQRTADLDIVPGLPTPVWGYDGEFPGPTIRARRDRPVVVEHRNELPVPTVVHLHGGRTPPESDGYPTDLVLPVGYDDAAHSAHHPHDMHDPRAVVTRGRRVYTFPSQQRAATLWYHDHRMDFTGPAVVRGLAGFHLVGDDEDDATGLPTGERDLPLMICDRSFAADGSFRYPSVDPSLMSAPGVEDEYVEGVLGDVVLVNGVAWPVHEVTATRHRLRLLNASNARRYDLALSPPPPGGGALVQVGSDQGLLEHPVAYDHLPISMAERYDVVVDFGRYPVGSEVTLVNLAGEGSTARVMRFRVTRAAVDESRVPERLSVIEPLDPAQSSVTREFTLRAGHYHGRDGWVVGGEPFSPTTVAAHPRLGATETWRFVADAHHPVHLHLVQARVLTRGGGPLAPTDVGLKDTVDLRPGEGVELLVRFDGWRGRYVFHCHNLEHEDMGMMANLEVV